MSTHLAKSVFVILILCGVIANAQQDATPRSSAIRATSSEVILNITVTNSRQKFVKDLQQDAFAILDNKEQQQIIYFSNENKPASIGIVFDLSGSMSGSVSQGFSPEKITPAKEAVLRLMQAGNSLNEYFLIGLSERPRLLADWTADGKAIIEALKVAEGKGNTPLIDACMMGMDKLREGKYPKRVLIVISDGQENMSRHSYKELRQALRESDVLLYAVSINNSYQDNALNMEGHGILEELASITGGRVYYPRDVDQARKVFELITLELQHQYLIRFEPQTSNKGREYHRIKIKINVPSKRPPELQGLLIRSREGYYLN